MSFPREKRLILGVLAFVAPLPLPFNDLLEWPILLLYWAVTGLFLVWAVRGRQSWLPLWAANVLALLYVPVLIVDLSWMWRGQLVRPLVHLALFALTVKLFALYREADKWHAVAGIYFVFLAATGTSVHPTIVLYLLVFLAASLWMLHRFAVLHTFASFGYGADTRLGAVPIRGFLAVGTGLTLLAAVPLFALLPRVRAPYLVGRGVGTGTQIEASGFTDEVSLDDITGVRTNRAVVARLSFDPDPPPGELRLRAASYDLYRDMKWRRSRHGEAAILRSRGGRFQLAAGAPTRWAHLWLERLGSSSLPLPVESVAVEIKAIRLALDGGGGISLPLRPTSTIEYRAGLAAHPVYPALPPADASDPDLDASAVTPRMERLAARVMGGGGALERARRLEAYLMNGYRYSLDVGGGGPDPIETFLFDTKSGHCEYFASAMTLLLRSQGIPARLVTGFLGAEYNPIEGYYVVRQLNAHAWVEAYLPGEGWRAFDPTPPSGRPASQAPSLQLLASQVWDYVLFRWDRYVLTYGFYDQLRVFAGLRDLWSDLWRAWFSSPRRPGEPTVATEPAAPSPAAPGRVAAPVAAVPWPVLGGSMVVLALVAVWLRQRRRPATAVAAYRRLRNRLAVGEERLVAPSAPPLAVYARLVARFPAARSPAGRIVERYLRESFGGEALDGSERLALSADLREAQRAMRRAAARGRAEAPVPRRLALRHGHSAKSKRSR